MLSKVADSLYWMARNVERSENIARLISVNLISSLENFDPQEDTSHNWRELIRINAELSLFDKHYLTSDKQSAIHFLCFSKTNPYSILNCIDIARDNAKGVREIIPSEMWELINSFYWNMQVDGNQNWATNDITSLLTTIKDQSYLFQGIMSATHSRGEAHSFMDLGRYIERAEKMTHILDVYFHKKLSSRINKEVADYHHWISVLQSVSGYEPYLRKNKSFIKPERVVEFLLFDESFPRSIHFCVSQLMYCFQKLHHGKIASYNKALYLSIGKLEANLKFTQIEDVLQFGAREYFADIQKQCDLIGENINKTYYLGELAK